VTARPDRIDQVLAAVAEDREQLLAKLAAEPAKHTAKPAKPWRVVRQYNHKPDAEACAHRWEWTADLCAYRRTARHPKEVGVHYTVRREPSR
jgi:hypothetical protein